MKTINSVISILLFFCYVTSIEAQINPSVIVEVVKKIAKKRITDSEAHLGGASYTAALVSDLLAGAAGGRSLPVDAAGLCTTKSWGYSPVVGAVALVTGLPENLRIFGNYTPGAFTHAPTSVAAAATAEAFGDGDFTERDFSKDFSDDPHWQLVKFLFPSANGTLNIGENHRGNLPHWLKKSAAGKDIRDRPDLVFLSNLTTHIHTLSTQTEDPGEDAHDFFDTFLDGFSRRHRKLLKPIVRTLEPTLKEAVKAEIQLKSRFGCASASGSSYESLYPVGTSEQIITAFVLEYLHTAEELEQYLEGVNAVLPEGSTFLWGFSHGQALNTIWDAHVQRNNALPIPVDPGLLISNGMAYVGSPDDRVGYADCVETVVRQIVNFTVFDAGSRSFVLPDFLQSNAALVAFYEKQPPALANCGDERIRTAWSTIVTNLNKGVEEGNTGTSAVASSAAAVPVPFEDIRYACRLGDVAYELESGHLNILRVLAHLCNQPLASFESPEGIPLGEWDACADEEARTVYIQSAYGSLLRRMNPGYEYVVYVDCSWASGRTEKEIYSPVKISFHAGEGYLARACAEDVTTMPYASRRPSGARLFSFDVISAFGHSKVIGVTTYQKFADYRATLTPVLSRLTDAAMLAHCLPVCGGVDSISEIVELPKVYRIFSRPLQDNMSYISGLVAILESALDMHGVARIFDNVQDSINFQDPVVSDHYSKKISAFYREGSPQQKDFIEEHAVEISHRGIVNLEKFRRLRGLRLNVNEGFDVVLPFMPGIERMSVMGNRMKGFSVENVPHVKELVFNGCGRLRTIDLSSLRHLESLYIGNCPELESLDVGEKSSVLNARIYQCGALKRINNLENMARLEKLQVIDCKSCDELTLGSVNVSLKELRLLWVGASEVTDLEKVPHINTVKFVRCDDCFMKQRSAILDARAYEAEDEA